MLKVIKWVAVRVIKWVAVKVIKWVAVRVIKWVAIRIIKWVMGSHLSSLFVSNKQVYSLLTSSGYCCKI